ncbi:rhamnogalacturonan acetylesterase [Flavobacterium jejuense]|uniref:Rhamnogalacturonan acetylesterase n=1 Tax=Flavobacterium jejuense TaxID=1544455 RepID=A0ABX0IRW2_9FLAO|nr:rhamnogalacturonan acetylesterase [Flavobacterium jejuense]NHN25825.1 rhamnogalacturonan acetylesterase [Flavobacterium jejuense]
MKIYKLFILSAFILFGCKSSDVTKSDNPKVTIYLIGDSTMANKKNPEENPEFGWGQVLPDFMTNNISISNHAVNGRSSKSFRELKHWKTVLDSLKSGDYVFIQFGHNDGKDTDPKRYTNPQTSYRYNLMQYVEETRSKGAIPVLFSSIARRKFNQEGVLLDSHGNYTLIARLVAQEMNVPFIDMQYLTEQMEIAYGVEESKKLHLHFEKGENNYFPEGKIDDTHLSKLGANEVANLATKELAKKVPALAKFIKNSK